MFNSNKVLLCLLTAVVCVLVGYLLINRNSTSREVATGIQEVVDKPLTQNCNFKTPQLIEGCEGEGCKSIDYDKAVKTVQIYKEPSVESQIVDTLNKCEKIKNFDPYLLIKSLGKAEITFINDDTIPNLKVGDVVPMKQYQGEGYHLGCVEDQDFAIKDSLFKSQNGISATILTEPQTEAWVKLTTPRDIIGYTPKSDFYLDMYSYNESLLCPGDFRNN